MNTFWKKRYIQVYGQDVVRYAFERMIKKMEGRKEGRKKGKARYRKKDWKKLTGLVNIYL